MDSKKINLKILKTLLFEIAKNNGTTLSDIAKKKNLDIQIVEEQITFLEEPALLDGVYLKNKTETLQKIAKILDNKELSRFMKTKYYKDNNKYFSTCVLNSLNENKLGPLPDTEYLDYAIKNSPSNVRFFLVDNDIKTLKSFYDRCISTENEKINDKIKIELLKKYNMYIIWDNVIFGKIQEDLQSGILLDPVNYFAGYLPVAKKIFEKLLEIHNMDQKTGNSQSNSKLRNYLKVLLT